MAILQVSPTRMNLLGMKKRIKTAKKGHKLLKDKRDGLMKEFMALIKEARECRKEVEIQMGEAFSLLLEASRKTNPKAIETALYSPEVSLDLEVKTKNVMSVHIPEFDADFSGNALNFALTGVSANLPAAIEKLQKIFPLLLRLAGIEKAVEELAKEIETTRRRVNALEHRMIPDLLETVKFIQLKLEEAGRDAVVSVMRIKAMIEAKDRLAKEEEKAKELQKSA
jgi:V/A-type H+-transporting ATPase subunit D